MGNAMATAFAPSALYSENCVVAHWSISVVPWQLYVKYVLMPYSSFGLACEDTDAPPTDDPAATRPTANPRAAMSLNDRADTTSPLTPTGVFRAYAARRRPVR